MKNTSKGFLSGITSTFVTDTTFLAAGAGAGEPQEKGSLFEEVVAGASQNELDVDFFPDAGASNLKGSLLVLANGSEVAPQALLEVEVLKGSVELLAPVVVEEPNGSLVPHGDLAGADVPKGSVLLVVLLVPNGSLVLPLANGSVLFVEPNGS